MNTTVNKQRKQISTNQFNAEAVFERLNKLFDHLEEQYFRITIIDLLSCIETEACGEIASRIATDFIRIFQGSHINHNCFPTTPQMWTLTYAIIKHQIDLSEYEN